MTCDTAYARINCPIDEVFAFIADPQMLSLWSFGTWSVEIDDTGLIHGRSIKDGSVTLVRIAQHADQFMVDYLIGPTPDSLQPRIFIRLMPGAVFGGTDTECALMMTALRSDSMDDARWEGMTTLHAFEVSMIKSAIETGYDHRNV